MFWDKEVHPHRSERVGVVQTRAQKAQEGKGTFLQVPSAISGVDKEEVIKAQEVDESLKTVRNKSVTGQRNVASNGDVYWYERHDGLIYRMFQSPHIASGKLYKQLVVPTNLRNQVMKLAHDTIFAGHQGIRKSKAKVLVDFYWAGVQAVVARYCRSCDICPKTFSKGKVPKIPVGGNASD